MKYLIFIIALLILCCDAYRYSRDPISLDQVNYDGTLKTDGYYYYDNIRNDNSSYLRTIFLYRNGVFLDGSSYADNLQEIDQWYENPLNYSSTYETAFDWGLFKVSGSEIVVEKWIGSGGGPYPTKSYVGEVINDSTLIIEDGFESTGILDTFHFRKFSPKPDSTNMFIE